MSSKHAQQKSKKLAPPKPNINKPKLSHNSMYYKVEFPPMYVPVPLRTAITFRLFWWNKLYINVKAVFLTIKGKFKKPEPPKPEKVKVNGKPKDNS